MNFKTYFNKKVLMENPDQLYDHKFSPFFTFFFIGNCVIYSMDEDYTHTHILEYLQFKHGNTNISQTELDYIKYEMPDADEHLKIVGQIPDEFVKWLQTSKGDVWTGYNMFNHFYMSGRVTKNHKPNRRIPETCVMSFWQEEGRLNAQNKHNIEIICNRLDIEINDCIFEFGQDNETLRRWNELEIVKNALKNEKPIHQVIHNISPKLKGDVMKKMGILPKNNPTPLADRYKLGMENFKTYFYQVWSEARFSDKEYSNPNAAWRLTQDEYLKETNKSGMWHSSDAYKPSDIRIFDFINHPVNWEVQDNQHYPGWKKMHWTLSDGSHGYADRISPSEISNEHDIKNFILGRVEDEHKKETVLFNKYWYQNPKTKSHTVRQFPYKIHSANGIDYRIKKEPKKYAKMNPDNDLDWIRDDLGKIVYQTDDEARAEGRKTQEITVAAFDGSKIIGMAVDEWGALLVTVDPEYRGKGIGVNLSHLYLSIYPDKDSGGYSDLGKNMAKKVHSKAVQDAAKLGWYIRAVKEGILTQDEIQDIQNSTK